MVTEYNQCIGNSTSTFNRLERTSSWIIEEALQSKHDNNLAKAYVEVDEITIPKGANVIMLCCLQIENG